MQKDLNHSVSSCCKRGSHQAVGKKKNSLPHFMNHGKNWDCESCVSASQNHRLRENDWKTITIIEIVWGYFMGYIMIYWPSNRFVGVTENENI